MTHAQNTPSPSQRTNAALSRENLELLVRRKALIKVATEITKQQQSDVQLAMNRGDSKTVYTEAGVKLGKITMSDPTPKAVVADEAIVLGSLTESEIAYEINDVDAAVEVLLEHAPELLNPVPTERALNAKAEDALNQWRATGEEPLGWRITSSGSTLSVRPDKQLVETSRQEIEKMTQPQLEKGDQ